MTHPKLPRGYCDLNLPHEPVTTIKARIMRAVSLGYETLAVNVTVNQDDLISKKQKNKAKRPKLETTEERDKMTDFPEAPKIALSPEEHAGWPCPVILTRLTLIIQDNNFQPIWNTSETAKAYDLVAICPTSAQTLTNVLKSAFKADIIAFDPERVRDVRWSRKLYNECVAHLMFFEIAYGPCLRDSQSRRNSISQSHNYHLFGKSKRIFISSQANHVLELRSPYDVANLGFLFGLNEHQGHLGVKQMGHEAVKSGLGRKMGPFRALIQKVEDLPEGERHKVPKGPPDEATSSEESEDEAEESPEESPVFLKL